jgi:hypothetical protein
MRTPMVLALAGMLTGAPYAGADCACLCVDGAWQTVCTSARERGATVDLCPLRTAAAECPAPPAQAPRQSYAAPEDGVGNCRDVQVYDPAAAAYVGARVCDLGSSR